MIRPRSALGDDQTIQEAAENFIGTRLVSWLFFVLHECDDLFWRGNATDELSDLEDFRVADVEEVAETAEDVVGFHGVCIRLPRLSEATVRQSRIEFKR